MDNVDMFPMQYNRSYQMEDVANVMMHDVAFYDEKHWFLYHIESTTKSIGKMTTHFRTTENTLIQSELSMRNELLKQEDVIDISRRQLAFNVSGLRFYEPMNNQFIDLNMQSSGDWMSEDQVWRLELNDNHQLWTLYWNDDISYTLNGIEPFLYHSPWEGADIAPSSMISQPSQVHAHKIRLHLLDTPLFNGEYEARDPGTYWKRFDLFKSPNHIVTASDYFRQVIQDKCS